MNNPTKADYLKGAEAACRCCGHVWYLETGDRQYERPKCPKCHAVNFVKWELTVVDDVRSEHEPRGIKPIHSSKHDSGTYLCPDCKTYIGSSSVNNSGQTSCGRNRYCPVCGQRIDWRNWKDIVQEESDERQG